MKNNTKLFIVFLLIAAGACEYMAPAEPEEYEELDGPIEGLRYEEQKQFRAGDIAFDEVFTIEKGLGPVFVATSCESCHAGDGKGHPFVKFIRFGQSDSTGNPWATFGDRRNQLKHNAIPGYEGQKLPKGAPFSEFIAPIVVGLGYLDAVPDETILAMADPDDEDGDGIRGRPHYNYLPDYVEPRPNSVPKNGKYIYRFGHKASTYDLLHQTVDAYNQDIGITSIFNPTDPYSGLQQEPEIAARTIHDVVFYLKTLKAPEPRDQEHPDVIEGKKLFEKISCSACHVPTLKTGFSPIEKLSYQEFHPYTDLLLHDMGPELNDGYTEGYAKTSEWRTAPLWGLGLAKDSQGGRMYLMHDGRARSIEEAILLHGGEAENSSKEYKQLAQDQKDQLLRFLNSL